MQDTKYETENMRSLTMKKQTGNKDVAKTKGFKYPPILPIS